MSTNSESGIDTAARWMLNLLGGFELRAMAGDERVAVPGRRERLLLSYLAMSPNGRRSRSKLAVVLWGDTGARETVLDNLRTCLWALRKVIGDVKHDVIASDGDDIVLNLSAFEVDALTFRTLAAREAAGDLEVAANLYRGELLGGLEIEGEQFESWLRTERTSYQEQIKDVLLRLMAKLDEAGETKRAIESGLRMLQLDPLHEAAARRLMRLYAGSDRRTAAIQVYRELVERLREELDVEPQAETQCVYEEVRGSSETVRQPSAAPPGPMHSVPNAYVRPGTTPLPGGNAVRRRAAATVLAVALLTVCIGGAYWYWREIPRSASTSAAAHAISIVVLPLANLSGDPAQEFFSDGMTEEITAALVKVPNLRVVARTSAFQFKGQGRDIRGVAQSLGATHVLEGSVRKDGSRVRISAQLILAGTGTHLWTKNYDRELTDLFAVQDEIAHAIAVALQIPLGLPREQSLVATGFDDAQLYEQYLRARTLVHVRGHRELMTAAALLEQVVAEAPGYAAAWATLAYAYNFIPNFDPFWFSGDVEGIRRAAGAALPKAEAAARRAIELDPNLADGYAQLALALDGRGRFAEAEDLYIKALALDPNNPDALHLYSRLLAGVGSLKKSLEMRQHLRTLDPFVPVYNSVTAWLLWLDGQTEAAIALHQPTPSLHRGYGLPRLLAAEGLYQEAADVVRTIPQGTFLPGTVEEAERLLRSAPAQVASPEALPRLGLLDFVYLHIGAPDRILDFYEAGADAGYTVSILYAFLWHPSYAFLRNTERFKTLMHDIGAVDYWRARGWTELCQARGDQNFTCR